MWPRFRVARLQLEVAALLSLLWCISVCCSDVQVAGAAMSTDGEWRAFGARIVPLQPSAGSGDVSFAVPSWQQINSAGGRRDPVLIAGRVDVLQVRGWELGCAWEGGGGVRTVLPLKRASFQESMVLGVVGSGGKVEMVGRFGERIGALQLEGIGDGLNTVAVVSGTGPIAVVAGIRDDAASGAGGIGVLCLDVETERVLWRSRGRYGASVFAVCDITGDDVGEIVTKGYAQDGERLFVLDGADGSVLDEVVIENERHALVGDASVASLRLEGGIVAVVIGDCIVGEGGVVYVVRYRCGNGAGLQSEGLSVMARGEVGDALGKSVAVVSAPREHGGAIVLAGAPEDGSLGSTRRGYVMGVDFNGVQVRRWDGIAAAGCFGAAVAVVDGCWGRLRVLVGAPCVENSSGGTGVVYLCNW